MEVPWLGPNHYQMVLGALAMLVILSLLLERALAVIFEWGKWRKEIKERRLRAPIALVVSYVICICFNSPFAQTWRQIRDYVKLRV